MITAACCDTKNDLPSLYVIWPGPTGLKNLNKSRISAAASGESLSLT